MIPPNRLTHKGRVIGAYGSQYEVQIEGEGDVRTVRLCSPRGKKGLYVCGDEVEVAVSNETQGVIHALLPRRSLFYRADAFQEKLIAANVTQVVIVVATEPGFSDELVMRCLCAVEAQNLVGLIVLNKSDLIPPLSRARDLLAPFERVGHRVIEVSARNGMLGDLYQNLSGQVSLMVGQSGMGKTSLINALVPEAGARTGILSQVLKSGKHTTTHAQWYALPGGGALIDSPGLQAFGLAHLSFEEIAAGFRELKSVRGQCRFRDCQHDREPNCAFQAARLSGEIDARRFQVFQTILAEHRKKPKF